MSKAFVIGATGAVGSELVRLLAGCQDFGKVVILARRNIEGLDEQKFEQRQVDFDKIEEEGEALKGVNVGFCAMGTTRAKSGADGFYKVDHDYVVNTAKVAKENGCKEFVLISSAGANEGSLFLYPKTKGQVEREITELGFEKFVILRPGLIEAERPETRVGETIFKFLVKPLKFVTSSLSSSATQIAQTMIIAARSPIDGNVSIWNNCKIIEESRKFENPSAEIQEQSEESSDK